MVAIDKNTINVERKLDKKYHRKAVNIKAISKDIPNWKHVISIITNIFLGLLVIFSALFCFNVLNNRAQGTPTSFFGYSSLRIVSGSMSPKYKIGDSIMVHSVDPHTLNIGDNIAFYVYSDSVNQYKFQSLADIEDVDRTPQYTFQFNQLLGIHSNSIRLSAKNGATLVFHQIVWIEEDVNGEWWFQTKGTNNTSADLWRINENYVVGLLVEGGMAQWFSNIMSTSSTSWLFLLALLIPVVILAVMVSHDSFRNLQLARLESECIEEKRKITDPICVKNNIGFNMNKKSKYKVLATASDDEKITYVNLLWREDEIPNCVRKYVMKRNFILRPLQKLRDINRECEKMYKEGRSLAYVGKYYERERQKIDNEVQLRYSRLLKLSKATK